MAQHISQPPVAGQMGAWVMSSSTAQDTAQAETPIIIPAAACKTPLCGRQGLIGARRHVVYICKTWLKKIEQEL
jgi:hypothetical protein